MRSDIESAHRGVARAIDVLSLTQTLHRGELEGFPVYRKRGFHEVPSRK